MDKELLEKYRQYTEMITASKEDLNKLFDHCNKAYHYEQEPTCIEWKKSFLTEDGTDPLRFIYIFKNDGIPDEEPRHWHYIGFGLSDIHGYTGFCRMYEIFKQNLPDNAPQSLPDLYPPELDTKRNGFGFELTFRLRCTQDADWSREPPSWPRKMMQDLARYVLQSRNTFSNGDHITWHTPLDANHDRDQQSASKMKHILMSSDPQLKESMTSMGLVKFIQIVGVCDEELRAACQLNVREVLVLMRGHEETGGQSLITDMTRTASIFELDAKNHKRIESAICRFGSDMALISDDHKCCHIKPAWFTAAENSSLKSEDQGHQVAIGDSRSEAKQEYLTYRAPSRMSYGSESALRIENVDLNDIRYLQSVYIQLSLESAKVLPIMLSGRLKHKRPFSFQRGRGDSLITFLPEGSPIGSLVSEQRPFAKQAHWLQVYVTDNLRQKMFDAIKSDFLESSNAFDELKLPKNYSWPDHKLYLTVVEEIRD